MGIIKQVGYSVLIIIVIATVVSTILYFTTNVFKSKEKTSPSPETTKIVIPETTNTVTPETTKIIIPETTNTSTPETTKIVTPAEIVPELAPCYQGDVAINWGHKEGDASWACNSWKSSCGNGGGCTATGDGVIVDGKSTWKCNLKTNCKAN